MEADINAIAEIGAKSIVEDNLKSIDKREAELNYKSEQIKKREGEVEVMRGMIRKEAVLQAEDRKILDYFGITIETRLRELDEIEKRIDAKRDNLELRQSSNNVRADEYEKKISEIQKMEAKHNADKNTFDNMQAEFSLRQKKTEELEKELQRMKEEIQKKEYELMRREDLIGIKEKEIERKIFELEGRWKEVQKGQQEILANLETAKIPLKIANNDREISNSSEMRNTEELKKELIKESNFNMQDAKDITPINSGGFEKMPPPVKKPFEVLESELKDYAKPMDNMTAPEMPRQIASEDHEQVKNIDDSLESDDLESASTEMEKFMKKYQESKKEKKT